MPSIIVAPQPEAVNAGAQVLRVGGNAIDAAVTTAFVQGVVDPHQCGIGGYLLAQIDPTGDGHPIVIDAPARAGAKATPDIFESDVIGPSPTGWGFAVKGRRNSVGYESICTPGTVMGLAQILERWGTISWEDAIAPAIEIAEKGYVVHNALAWALRLRLKSQSETSWIELIEMNDEARRVYLKADGTPPEMGETIRNPDYAASLRHLANHGATDFYQGEMAQRLSADLDANGSFVTAADLENYKPDEMQPLIGTYRGYTVSTSQAPHGGPTVLEILNILEGYDLGAMEHNSPQYIYRMAMAMKAAFADRNSALGDPGFVPIPLDTIIDKAHGEYWRGRIERGEPIQSTLSAAAPGTTHVNVIDSQGMCVSLNTSLGSSSGVITPGMGFMWNNSMINFYPYPGHPNSIAPGKARTTGMAPTILYRDGKPVAVIGAPGGNRIITSIVTTILNLVDFGMGVHEAVLAPRFDCQGETIYCHRRIPEFVIADVRKKHPIQPLFSSYGELGLVQALVLDGEKWTGAADVGSQGMALVVG
jgi:gamma-glutamyltranspeptidase / glutathione hydrolase